MKKIGFFSTLCIFLVIEVAFAQQQVSKIEAINAAFNSLLSKAEYLNTSSDTEIDTVFFLSNKRSNVIMYEVIFKNRATLLLSGSKACLPVLGYYIKPEDNNGSIFDTTNLSVPCCFQDFLNDYIRVIDWCFTQENIELFYEQEWRKLQHSYWHRDDSTSNILAGPLLKTAWGQSHNNNGVDCKAYNYYVSNTCSSGCNCPTGCVATAMGQIMKHWNYPVYLPNQSYQYDWCTMPDSLYKYFPPDYMEVNFNYEKERNAIARLLKDCGEKVDMDYCANNTCASGAFSSDARKAFVNDFGYSNDADFQRKAWWTSSVWKERIKNNLDQEWPVYYEGHGSGSHAFVCDGYNNDDKFHFNWGWAGNYNNSWFTLDDLTPNDHNFTSTQRAIFYIHPDSTQNYCNFSLPLWAHYFLYYNVFGNTTPFPHQNVPKTFTTLESVPEDNDFPTSWHTIESGQSTEYITHETITLKSGFQAKAGSHFVARIEPCANCNSAKVTVKRLKNGMEVEEELYIAVGDADSEMLLGESENKIIDDEPQVYPNPTTGLLTIHAINNNSHIQIIEIYNTEGTKLFTFNGTHSYFQEIDISHLPSQVYMLKIQVSGQIFTKKLILQK